MKIVIYIFLKKNFMEEVLDFSLDVWGFQNKYLDVWGFQNKNMEIGLIPPYICYLQLFFFTSHNSGMEYLATKYKKRRGLVTV